MKNVKKLSYFSVLIFLASNIFGQVTCDDSTVARKYFNDTWNSFDFIDIALLKDDCTLIVLNISDTFTRQGNLSNNGQILIKLDNNKKVLWNKRWKTRIKIL